MFCKAHEEAELSGVTFQDLEDILVSVRASSWDIVLCFLLSFSFHVDGGFCVSPTSLLLCVPPARDIRPALVTLLRACAPYLNFLQDIAELCVDVPFVTWPILAPGLGG